jgi:signal peptidase I
MRTALRRLRSIASALLVAGAFALAAAVLVPAALGYERYVITSGSMAGSYDRGSIVYARPVPVGSLAVGDVITFAPPRVHTGGGLVTHRIASIGRDARGRRVFRTKGDANRSADPWKFSLARPTQPRAAFRVPHAGYLLAALSVREVRMAAIGGPALLIALGVLARLWAEAGAEQRRRREAAAREALAGSGA